MGDARNAILANTAEVFIAVGGSHGTLSEIAFACKRGKRVVRLDSWDVDPAVLVAESPENAVELALG
jgi:predicted Rossmann-fold nucleotide-binding protein